MDFSSVAVCLHVLFVGITLVGGILFLAWALKLKADELKKWVVRLLVVGIIGSLITGAFGVPRFRMKHMGMMNKEVQMMEAGKMMVPGEMMKK